MDKVTDADFQRAAGFIRSDACPLGMKMMFGTVANGALMETLAAHRQAAEAKARIAALEEVAGVIENCGDMCVGCYDAILALIAKEG